MVRFAFAVTTAAAVATAIVACGQSRMPAPAFTSHPSSALLEVPFPPPPARVEFIPESPRETAVWLDGEWIWQGRRYAWKPGRWVEPPANAAFAPWRTVRNDAGTLYIAEGTWRDREGREITAPPILAEARPSVGSITDPEGERVTGTPITAADAGTLDKSGGESTAPAFVDAGVPPPPDGKHLPEGGLAPSDGGLLPDASGFDAAILDASPVAIRVESP